MEVEGEFGDGDGESEGLGRSGSGRRRGLRSRRTPNSPSSCGTNNIDKKKSRQTSRKKKKDDTRDDSTEDRGGGMHEEGRSIPELRVVTTSSYTLPYGVGEKEVTVSPLEYCADSLACFPLWERVEQDFVRRTGNLPCGIASLLPGVQLHMGNAKRSKVPPRK